jgi:hypothetical protein
LRKIAKFFILVKIGAFFKVTDKEHKEREAKNSEKNTRIIKKGEEQQKQKARSAKQNRTLIYIM